MHRISFKWTHIAPVFAAFALVYCGSPANRGTNLTVSDGDAALNIKTRLMQTDQARERIDSLLESLQPFHNALQDVSKMFKKADSEIADRIQRLDEDLRKALQEASKGLAQIQPDGSWVIKRRIELSIERKNSICRDSEIKVTGYNSPEGDRMDVVIHDCAIDEALPVATFLARKGKLEIQYFPNSLERLLDNLDKTVEIGKCTVQVERDFADLTCEPMNFRGHDLNVSIASADFHRDRDGARARVVIQAKEPRGDGHAEALFISEPGMPPRIELKVERNGQKHELKRNINL